MDHVKRRAILLDIFSKINASSYHQFAKSMKSIGLTDEEITVLKDFSENEQAFLTMVKERHDDA